MVKETFAEDEGVSRELSLHPVHLTPDQKGNLPPSALVPFCSFRGDRSLLGEKRPELGNITMCNKFHPTTLGGQLCYSLDVTKVKRKTTKSGKAKGLFLLLDPNPYPLNSSKKDVNFKLHIHTLARFTAYRPGTFAMSTLKRMTGTKSFKQLPDKQKKCLVHNREECQTKKYLDQVEGNCGCHPWAMVTDQKKTSGEHSPVP